MRRVLGKGLSQLIGEQIGAPLTELAVADIVPNKRQPRTVFDEAALEDLAASIREHGILQPLVVRPLAEGKYELIAGERRLRASKLAGLERVPVVVRAAGAQASLELALIENLQREDIGAMEAARAYRRLIDEFALKQDDIAGRVGKSRVAIANTLRLLKLPDEVQEAVERGEISEGHARAVLGAETPAAQIALCRRIIAKGLSVREAERATQAGTSVRRHRKTKSGVGGADPNWLALEERLSQHFGAPIRLTGSETGGELAIAFYSGEDLQRILDVLGVSL